jgi:hypothetical protein
MSSRFRIRTPQGQELSFASDEMFQDFVRSGALSEGDLIYDASTGEWSPALTHSLVLEVQAGAESAGGGHSSPEKRGGAPDTDGSPPEGDAQARPPTDEHSASGASEFDLAPEQTPAEASAASVREMEEERAAEFEQQPRGPSGLQAEEGSQGLLKDVHHDPLIPEASRRASDSPSGPGSSPPRVGDREPPKRSRKQRARDGGAGWGVSGRFVMWVLALGAIGVAGLLGADLVALAIGAGGADEDGPADVSVLPDTEEALQSRAESRFLGSMRPLFMSLPAVPSTWLSGHYLASASEYPDVAAAWSTYFERIRDSRDDETEIYSEAFLSALDDARVTGANRTLRLAAALSRFERNGALRVAHYQRVEELAVAALDLHDLLLEREDRITYEPAVGPRVSADPVLQAAGSDPETQDLLEAALDRVLDALSAGGEGPVEAQALPQWIFEGLRRAVESE